VGNKIITASGKIFDFNAMSGDAICIEDIARALGNLCRFTGHCRYFYSVAQHSVLCYELSKALYPLDPNLWLAVLMHDAQESYLNDISTPLKALLPRYQELESELEAIIAEKFNLSGFYKSTVKYIDRSMLKAEKKHLFPGTDSWAELESYPDYEIQFYEMGPVESSDMFVDAYDEVTRIIGDGDAE
jgi:hypothetical protein